MKIDWLTTILTIVGALVGVFVGQNIAFLRDLIPIFGTSVGIILAVIVFGGIGGAVGSMMKAQASTA
jgi:hypothetical protein